MSISFNESENDDRMWHFKSRPLDVYAIVCIGCLGARGGSSMCLTGPLISWNLEFTDNRRETRLFVNTRRNEVHVRKRFNFPPILSEESTPAANKTRLRTSGQLVWKRGICYHLR